MKHLIGALRARAITLRHAPTRWVLHHSDCRDVLRGMADNSIDSVVCDPPYHLTSIVKRFGPGSAPQQHGTDGAYARASRGFMGQTWDGGDIAFDVELWAEVFRVLKPGGYLLACGGTRTYHRMACAIEDAGFEIRDMISWLYGSGFPKGSVVDGRGPALKPAQEPIVMARKPLGAGSIARNLAEWGTGALRIDDCRVPSEPIARIAHDKASPARSGYGGGLSGGKQIESHTLGRFPANVIHNGSPEVRAEFPDSGPSKAGGRSGSNANPMSWTEANPLRERGGHDDAGGSAARFYYCAKASKADRDEGCGHLALRAAGRVSENSGQHMTRRDEGYEVAQRANIHPTVKPTDLMRYLVRLVTPPGGLVFDPFTGSGSTGKAALLEGCRFVGAEMTAEYIPIARARIAHAARQVA